MARWHRSWFLMSVALLVGTSTVCAQNSVSVTPMQSTVVPDNSHSPRKALQLSLLPGAGQVYNRQAWKIPIIYGAFTLTGYFIYSNYTQMINFRDEYLLRVNGGAPAMVGYTNYPDNSIYNYYQSYNQSFQLSVILSVAIYALNLVDAYVYGHLFEFQIDDDISLALQPSVQTLAVGEILQPVTSLSCSFRF